MNKLGDISREISTQNHYEGELVSFLHRHDVFGKGPIDYDYGLYLSARIFSISEHGVEGIQEKGRIILESLSNALVINIGDGRISKGLYFEEIIREYHSKKLPIVGTVEGERQKLLQVLSLNVVKGSKEIN